MVLGAGGLLLLFGLPILLGIAGLRAAGITWRTDPVAYGGWVWMTGALLLAALELLRLVVGCPSPGPLLVAGLALGAALWGYGRRRPLVAPEPARAESAAARIFLGAALGLALFVTLVRGLGADWTAIVRDDEAIYWSRRAKLWFEAGGFGGVYARAMAAGDLPNAGSPVFNPLLQLWVFDLAGRITHVVNRVPIQVFSLALVLCTAGALRRAAGSWVAAPLLLVFVASAPAMIATHKANSDVLVALAALVGGDALLNGRGRAGPALAGLSATLLVWSKNEGLLYLVAFLAACLLLHARRARAVLAWPASTKLWCLPVAAVLASTAFHNAWFEARSTHGIGTEELSRFADAFERVPPIGVEIVRAFFDAGLNLVPGVFLLACLAAPRAWRGRLGLLTLTVVLAWLGLVLVYATTPDPLSVIPKSLARVLSQLVPLQLLWLGALAQRLRTGEEEPTRGEPVVRPSRS